MATKSSAATRRQPESEQNMMQMQMPAHEQLADLTEKTATLFQEVEAVQQVQQHSAQRAALKLQQAAEQMRHATSPTEWVSIQSTLMMGGMQEMAQYLQEISVTLMRMQVALIPRMPTGRATESAAASAVESTSSSALNGASTAADAASAATAAVFQSWSNMLGAALPKDARASH
jgi:hypothetical protein